MRAASVAVFVSLAIRCWVTTTAEEFKPTPIPLEWRRAAASYFQSRSLGDDPQQTDKPYYWEDALRHSVYLTLVRDNIDALIAKGEVISSEQKESTTPAAAQETEDKDLWEKIKNAPFIRIPKDETPPFGDVALVSSGKLIDDDGQLKFKETDRNSPDCYDCEVEAKALWSVKRIRHRDQDQSGSFTYELTFSVVTKPSKYNRKPHENPARTFTVQESSPQTIKEDPKENRAARKQRPEKSLWIHKNIYEQDEWGNVPPQIGVDAFGNPDRMFGSFFRSTDKKPRVYAHYDQPYALEDTQRKYITVRGPPPGVKHQKKPLPDQQKKLTPYPYKPHGPHKIARPPSPQVTVPHSQHHYLDIDAIGVVSSPYIPPQEHRYTNPTKQKYPLAMPHSHLQHRPLHTTPVFISQSTQPPLKINVTEPEVLDSANVNITNGPAPSPLSPQYKPDIFPSVPTKTKQTTIRYGYAPDHVRPPVYNTPPGVFVTMDKKPFKPLPPLKLQYLPRPNKPLDFRPSPQVLDVQFSEPDTLFDSFRPINVNNTRWNDTAPDGVVAESSKSVTQIPDNETTTESLESTTAAPRRTRITSTSTTTSTTTTTTTTETPIETTESPESMDWTHLLTAFTSTDIPKTEPKKNVTNDTKKEANERPMTTTEFQEEQITSTTEKPTRLPYKPKKKHKRITSTTTTTSTTARPTRKIIVERSTTTAAYPSSTEHIERTSALALRQLNPTSTYTSYRDEDSKTDESQKPKSRYRLSTLMVKGTSVKHDKWSVQATEQKPITIKPGKHSRRTSSNFVGYHTSTVEPQYVGAPFKIESKDQHYEAATPNHLSLSPDSPDFESTKEGNDFEDEYEDLEHDVQTTEKVNETTEKQKQKTKQKLEDTLRTRPSNVFSLKTNDRMEDDKTKTSSTATEIIETTPHNPPKNNTKCKKKHQKKPILPEVVESPNMSTTSTTTEATTQTEVAKQEVTEKPNKLDIFDELFGMESQNIRPDRTPEMDNSEEDYKDTGEDDIFDEIFGSESTSNPKREDHEKADNSEDSYSGSHLDDFFTTDDHFTPITSNDSAEQESRNDSNDSEEQEPRNESNDNDLNVKPYSLLELMAMEN